MNKKEMKRQLWEHLLQELGKMLSTLKYQVDSYQKMKIPFTIIMKCIA